MTNDSIIEIKCYCGEKYFASEKHLGSNINCSCGRLILVARQSPPQNYNSAYYDNTNFQNGKPTARNSFSAGNIAKVVFGVICLLFVGKVLIGHFQTPDGNSNIDSSRTASSVPYPAATSQPTPNLVYNRNYNQTIEIPPDLLDSLPKPVSLKNGTAITPPQGRRGRGFLRIINGFDTDVAVKLVENTTGKTRRFFYVRANSRATVKGIAAEDCRLFFSTGEDWDKENKKFIRNAEYNEFNMILDFRRTDHQVSLKPSIDGTVPVEPIDEEKFADK